jgi:hypothetical protein
MSVAFTVFSNAQTDALTGFPFPLSKTFALGSDGKLSPSTAAYLTDGTAERIEVGSPAEFAERLPLFGPHQALAFGVTERATVRVTTQKQLRGSPGKIARDRQHLAFKRQPGILFVDYDYKRATATAPPLTAEQVRAHLIAACPALADAPMVATSSTSSFIYHGDAELQGAGGCHLYVFVADATDIERAGPALVERLWLAGFGRFEVSKAGHLLDKCLIDGSVWQPERLDFIRANCVAPLEQRRPAPMVWNNDAPLFDTRLITDPTPSEAEIIAQKRREARATVEPERQEVRQAYVEDRTEVYVAAGVDPIVARRTAEQAVDNSALLGPFALMTEDGREVTVSHVLANRNEFHGTRFRDPMEPNYGNDPRIARANLFGGGRPVIFSHAHGGRRYQLYPQTDVLQLPQPRDELVRRVLELMRIHGEVFDQPIGDGGRYRLVYVSERKIIPVTEAWLANYVSRLCRCEKFDKRSGRFEPVDFPDRFIRNIMEASGRELPKLESVIGLPMMRPDGSILDNPGYSARDQVLFLSDDFFVVRVPATPTEDEIRAAAALLWRPVRDFAYDGPVSRGVKFAALLTVPVRAAIPTAPGYLYAAPMAGSGKSLLAKCDAALLTGRRGVASTPPTSDEDQRKALFSAVRSGLPYIFWDNFTLPIKGTASLCAFLTAPIFSDRVLGVSDMQSYKNASLFLMTGNNPTVEGDAARRILRCRIDAEVENPEARTFEIEPERYVIDHRLELWNAALTILRGFFSRGAPKQTQDTVGSFEDWDKMVRQCVIWLQRSGLAPVELADPYVSALENIKADPTRETVLSVMGAWRAVFGNTMKSPGEVIRALAVDGVDVMFDPKIDELRRVIEEIGMDRLTPHRFGAWLEKHTERRIGGLRFVRVRDDRNHTYRYSVRVTEPAAAVVQDNSDLIS